MEFFVATMLCSCLEGPDNFTHGVLTISTTLTLGSRWKTWFSSLLSIVLTPILSPALFVLLRHLFDLPMPCNMLCLRKELLSSLPMALVGLYFYLIVFVLVIRKPSHDRDFFFVLESDDAKSIGDTQIIMLLTECTSQL
jgi:hypothetical protein